MAAQLETLERKLLTLPAPSRERLAYTLLESLPGVVAYEFTNAELSEFARRSAEVSAGTADLVPYNDVMAEVERALHGA